MKLIYSAEAVQDLMRLREFIAEKNPSAATRIATELVARIDQLCQFPEMGRNVEQAPIANTIQDFVFGDYIVRYAHHSSAISILRIWHHNENQQ
jgi:toxin ParE1/3/4